MERIIIITPEDKLFRASYTSPVSLDNAVGGEASPFLSTSLPVMEKIVGSRSLPVSLYCRANCASENGKLNAIATLLSGKEIRGDAAMVVKTETRNRGFHFATEKDSEREALCECWAAEDSVLLYMKFNKEKIADLHKKYDKKNERTAHQNR